MEDSLGAVTAVIEVVGVSETSYSDAARNAVKVTAMAPRDLRRVEMLGSSAGWSCDRSTRVYKVKCKIEFLVARSTAKYESR